MIFEQKCFWGIEIELLFSEIRKTVEELCMRKRETETDRERE